MLKPIDNMIIRDKEGLTIKLFSIDYVDYYASFKENIKITANRLEQYENKIDHINISILCYNGPIMVEILTINDPIYLTEDTMEYSKLRKSYEFSKSEILNVKDQIKPLNTDDMKQHKEKLEHMLYELQNFKKNAEDEMNSIHLKQEKGDTILGINGINVKSWNKPVIIFLKKLRDTHA